MKTPERLQRLVVALAMGLVLSPCSSALAQQGSTSQKPAAEAKSSEDAAKALTPQEKKRAALEADTEKLYRLTQELKAEVAKTNKDTLSVPVVRKAQEIEQLARSIKERSRNQ
ncbi:MAG TPA: hypothetical protein VGB69_03665 [Edaphobacter sp.]